MESLYHSLAPVCRTAALVSLEAIRRNGAIARKLFPEQKLLSILKADGYGHGIEGIIPAYECFTDWYAVATVEEGLTARAHTQKPILLLGPVPEAQMALAAQLELTFTVGSPDYAKALSRALAEAGLSANCHLKIETGLNRSGVRWRGPEALDTIKAIHSLPGLRFTGTYTHFACGEGTEDWELAFTQQQFERFTQALRAMEQAGLDTGLRHCTSTGGSLVHPQYRLDMVRLGMLPMGMSYCDESVRQLGLVPALTWVSWLRQIEFLPAGEAVSYGCSFRAEKDMRIGLVSCGYADGYRRAYSNKTHVLTGGKRVRVLGRIAMDYMLIDITDVDCQTGDTVILLGTDGVNTVSAQELAQFGESVSGEVTCAISPRVRRLYTEEEAICTI